MPALTKRKEPRFRTYVPIVVHVGQKPLLLVPHDISTCGCYFVVPPQIDKGTYRIQIGVEPGTLIEIPDAKYFQHDPPAYGKTTVAAGFGLLWSLNEADTTKLFQLLLGQSNQASNDAKVDFLAREQESLSKAILYISEQKQKGYRFLFALVAGYFGYLSAPLHFTFKTTEQAWVYAVGGVWASFVLLHYSTRFLSWLGRSARRSVFIWKAAGANRSWVLNNDGSYYAGSLFPSGTMYDDDRSWTWINDEKVAPDLKNRTMIQRKESFGVDIEYNQSTPLFHAFVQLLFLFGAIQFLSLIDRAWHDSKTLTGTKFMLFDLRSFSDAYSTFSLIAFAWILVFGNAWAQYQQRVWEARRISADRPNPRFTGKAFVELHPESYNRGRRSMYAVGVSLLSVRILIYLSPSLHRHVLSNLNWTISVVLVAFAVGRVCYAKAQMSAETDANKAVRTLRQLAKRKANSPSPRRDAF